MQPFKIIITFFDDIDKGIDVYFTYENVALAGDFNAPVDEKSFDIFLYQHELYFNKQVPYVLQKPK